MKVRYAIGVALTGLLAMCGSAMAVGAADSIEITGQYARAVPPGQPNSISYMTITNNGKDGAALLGAESPASKVLELHTHIHDNGMMRMRRVDKIDLPAGEQVMLEPGGLHVMLIGLNPGFRPGVTIDMNLVFDDGSKKAISLPVRKMQMKMMKGGMKHDMKNMEH